MIYIVTGTTGAYFDRETWLVAAYTEKLKAQQHVEAAEWWFKENGPSQLGSSWDNYIEWGKNPLKNPYDPEMQVDYTGTRYYLQMVEMFQKVPIVVSDA